MIFWNMFEIILPLKNIKLSMTLFYKLSWLFIISVRADLTYLKEEIRAEIIAFYILFMEVSWIHVISHNWHFNQRFIRESCGIGYHFELNWSTWLHCFIYSCLHYNEGLRRHFLAVSGVGYVTSGKLGWRALHMLFRLNCVNLIRNLNLQPNYCIVSIYSIVNFEVPASLH